jgi:serine phosphatase RsbU (regulator of sigma subunit)/Tfp pilus assembly protein PilF
MKKALFLFFIFNLSFTVCFSQQNKIDSLLILLKKDKSDTNKLAHLSKIVEQSEITGNYIEGLKYGSEAIDLADALSNNTTQSIVQTAKKHKTKIYNSIGLIYSDQGNYPEALKNYFSSLKISEEIGDKSGIASSYNNIGNIYNNQANYAEALKNQLAGLKIRDKIGDKKGIAVSYNNLGLIYYELNNYTEALKNHNASLKIKLSLDNKKGVANSYNNIGGVYEALNNYPEALTNYFASLKIKVAIGDKRGIATSYNNIGNIYTKQKKYKEADQYLFKAKKLLLEIGAKKILKETYFALSTLDSAKGDSKGAYENFKEFILYRDSLDNEDSRKKTVQSQMTFDFEKKEAVEKAEHKSEMEKQNAIAEEKNRKQNIVIWSVVIGLLLVVVFAAFVVRSLRMTRKQKNIIEEHKGVIEQKHKEITDSINYAERIQRSLLASKDLLDSNLKDYFVFFQPKDVVSGDFFWADKFSNGCFALVTADSTGHGVPGSIMSILNISCLKETIKEGFVEPADILNNTRTKIIEILKKDGSAEGGKDGMDCSFISFDFKNHKLTYAAAYNPVWIVRDKNILEFPSNKMPVGKHDKDHISFTQQEIILQQGDVVYTTTDGMPDQFGGPQGKKFMNKQLKGLLISIAELPMQEQKEKIATALNSWKGDLEQVDDICVIGVRV